MDLRRIAGLAGLLASALFILAVILTFAAGQPPALDESAQKVTRYYQDNRSTLQLTGIISFLILFIIPFWFIPIYRWIRDRSWATSAGAGTTPGGRAEDETGTWATLALAAFIATGVVNGVQTAVATAVASGIEDELGGNDATVTALFDLYNGLGAAIGPFFALLSVGVALVARGTPLFPNWSTPVLGVAAILILLSTFAPFTEIDFLAILGLIGFLLFIAVIIGSSLRLLGAAGSPTTTTTT